MTTGPRTRRSTTAAAPARCGHDHSHTDDEAGAPGDVEAALHEVPVRLRRARLDAKLTLADVSTATGIGTSTLSRLESGSRRPTLDLLLPLARVYRVPLDDLVGAPATGDPRVHPRPVKRHGIIHIPLSRNASGVQCVKMVMPVPDPGRRVRLNTHEGYEWLYVLSGECALHLGERVTVLGVGEAAEFDTRTPHALVNHGDTPLELLALFSPQGERIHLGGR